MKSFFEKFFSSEHHLSLSEEKRIAKYGKLNERLNLARNKKASPEILYYLAEHDESSKVKQAVIKNESSPIHMSSVLVRDADKDVRELLTLRLMKLLPDMSPETHERHFQIVSEALGVLALDEIIKIRIALSAALKTYAHTPPKLAAQLARDLEREVSEPILRYSLALPDEDLLDILQNYEHSWQVQAVALREKLNAPISQAVFETDDVEATSLLLSNKGAVISKKTMRNIVEKAKDKPEWHKAIAMRKNLAPELAKEMAFYINHSIKEILLRHQDLDGETIDEIGLAVERGVSMIESQDENLSIAERISQHKQDNTLNDDTVQTAMSVGDTDFVIAILADLSSISEKRVKKIIKLKAAKPFIALCWKSGLSMRTCLLLQRELVKLPNNEIIHPKDGFDYPLSPAEIKWQLEFLGIE